MPAARTRRVILVPVLLAALVQAPPPAGAAEEVRIIRDRFGVPHVYADTAEAASFGAGYALAQDRLWQMHVFRRIAKGRLSEILGPVVIDIDRSVRFFTYTEEERAARLATYPEDGRRNLQAFADGINAWIGRVRSDPSLMPFEFVEYGEPLDEDWTVDDSVALQDVLILSFGSGGGNELEHAALLQQLVERFGPDRGARMFDDLVLLNDPDAPTTIPRGYDYEREPVHARIDEAEARRGLEDDARLGLEGDEGGASRADAPGATGTLPQLELIPDVGAALEQYRELERGLRELRRAFSFGSNAQIAGPGMSETGNAAQTGGPQVGYLLPQWLADFGIHGGGLDATGMTFAGAGPAVLIGRGPGYAWTTTTGSSDLSDVYVERLTGARSYEYAGGSEPMDCRTEEYTFRGVPFQSEELCRTRHGPVVAFDEANEVAYSLRQAWFNREGQTVEGFFRYNEVESVEDFGTFANYLSSNHNMFYTDDRGNFGYWHPGNHPVRAAGVDLRLPQDGRGGSEWQGLMPIQDVPHAVNFDRGWLVNWNNQPAQPWVRERAHPVLDNVWDLEAALDPGAPDLPDPAGGLVNPDGPVDFEDLSANLRYAAFRHHSDTSFRPFLPDADDLSSELAVAAAGVVSGWDGFLTDRDGDGLYDSAGSTIVDRWVSRMRAGAFDETLGDLSGWASSSLLWHLLAPNDRLELEEDWLGDRSPDELAASAFESAVAELATEFDSEDPETWREEAETEHYQRLNADLFTDLAMGTAGLDTTEDSGVPGDVPDLIQMDRGTYNHVVVYQEPPGEEMGSAAAKAGSVIPPGQSGFISPTGQESPHYEDQLALYAEWRYKPMPLTEQRATALAESVEVVTYPG